MPIIVRKPESKFVPPPEGLYHAVCVDVIERPGVETQYGTKDMVELRWQLDELNERGNRHWVRARYAMTLGKKASLRKMLEVWRGKKFTEDELQGFDLEKLIGQNCQIQVAHYLGDEGQVYADVTAVIGAPRGAQQLKPLDYTREIDRPSEEPHHVKDEVHEGADDDVPF